jgi:acetoin utilization protein AcuC
MARGVTGTASPPRSLADGEPIVVYGPRSETYDFGPHHPLTPRRFGPAIDLLRALGADRFLAPEPADDGALRRLHEAAYIEAVKRFSADPERPAERGIGPGDDPAFGGMHEAAASVAGGSLAAMGAILAEQALHGFHPGGGLHHAMAGHASGFCIYNDVALACAMARDAGHRVLYLDFDVHHGDGVQALFWDDPQVMTLSIHETGETLFPGTGYVRERGGHGSDKPTASVPSAVGTTVNLPMVAGTGDASWLAALRAVLPALAEAFRPTMLVTQHGCDSHLLDPLAHLRLTTAAYREATLLADEIAHRWCDGRWLATGGGGYDVYRVVPRSWSLVWLAQAHREPPVSTPVPWRDHWADAAERWRQDPPAERFIDPPGTAADEPPGVVAADASVVELVRTLIADTALDL